MNWVSSGKSRWPKNIPMSPINPSIGGAGDGSFTKLNTTPTAKPVKKASVMRSIAKFFRRVARGVKRRNTRESRGYMPQDAVLHVTHCRPSESY